MRRCAIALLAGISAAVLSLPAAAAPQSGSVRDPAGDWSVPGQDIVAGQARAVGRDLVLSLRLTTAPTAGTYDVHLGTAAGATCHSVAARIRLVGTAVQRAYRVADDGACSTPGPTAQDVAAALTQDVSEAPVKVVVSGATVTWTLPWPSWLKPGQRVTFAGLVHEGLVVEAGGFQGGVDDGDPCSCDYSFGTFAWR